MEQNILEEHRQKVKEIKSISDQIRKIKALLYKEENESTKNTLNELVNKYEASFNSVYSNQLKIEKLIEDFDPIEKDLIRYRFFDGLRWEQVFIKLSYSQKQTFRIYKKILKKLER